MLLLNDTINALQVTLNLSFTSKFGDFAAGGHFFDIRFQFADSWTGNFFEFDVSF